MKRTAMLAVALAAGMVAWQFARSESNESTTPATQPTTQSSAERYKQASYGIGFGLGREMKENQIPLDTQLIMEGLQDGLAGNKQKVSDEDLQTAMMQIQQEIMSGREQQMQAEMKASGEKAKAEGDKYRAENAKKQGVSTTESGLQIETLKEGTGATPAATDTVKVHYTGTLVDGTKFDSSVDRGEPIEFPLNRVIKGWTEGVQKMKVGGKSRLVIPPEIGYGPMGSPPVIPPNATLIFDIELLDIIKESAPATQPAEAPAGEAKPATP